MKLKQVITDFPEILNMDIQNFNQINLNPNEEYKEEIIKTIKENTLITPKQIKEIEGIFINKIPFTLPFGIGNSNTKVSFLEKNNKKWFVDEYNETEGEIKDIFKELMYYFFYEERKCIYISDYEMIKKTLLEGGEK